MSEQYLGAPSVDMGPMTELIGYLVQARDDGEGLDPQHTLDLAVETRQRMLAPIRAWLREMGARDVSG